MPILTNKAVFSFTLKFVRGAETQQRVISFENYTDEVEGSDDVKNFAALLVDKYKNFIQPLNWRDSDVQEEEWKINSVVPKITVTNEVVEDEVFPAE